MYKDLIVECIHISTNSNNVMVCFTGKVVRVSKTMVFVVANENESAFHNGMIHKFRLKDLFSVGSVDTYLGGYAIRAKDFLIVECANCLKPYDHKSIPSDYCSMECFNESELESSILEQVAQEFNVCECGFALIDNECMNELCIIPAKRAFEMSSNDDLVRLRVLNIPEPNQLKVPNVQPALDCHSGNYLSRLCRDASWIASLTTMQLYRMVEPASLDKGSYIERMALAELIIRDAKVKVIKGNSENFVNFMELVQV